MANLHETRFVVLDTETTGAQPGEDRPIEIAAVEWIGGASGRLETWHVDPQMPIKPSAIAVHHLTQKDIQGKPTLDEVEDAIKEFVGDSPLVIHNAPFDLAMLPFFKEHPTICSLRLARHIWQPEELNADGHPLINHKAQTIRYWLDLEVDTMGLAAHRAGADILVTGHIFQSALERYLDLGRGNSLEEFMAFVQKPIEYARFPYGQHKGWEFSELPDRFLNFYLDSSRNRNQDPDLVAILREEAKRRLQETAELRRNLPSNQVARTGSFKPA